MKRLWFLIVSVLFLLAACSGAKSEEKTETTESRGKATEQMKTFRVGQIVDADGVDVRVVKAEYINDYDEYSAPENGKALKVTLKFKNNNSDQVLVDSSAFTMNVRGETYPDWYGGDGTDGMFSHQLNQGKTATGTLVFDVPDAKVYTLEMDTYFKDSNVKAKWNLHQALIREGKSHDSETEAASEEKTSKTKDDSEDYPYTAEEYNALVDEYNALTDGEKMNHVTRGVTNKEYNDLAARVEKLYEALGEEWEKEYQKQLDREEAEWQKEQDRLDKEFDAEMKRQDEAYQREEAARQKQEEADQRAYEAEMKRQDEQAAREEEAMRRQEAELQRQEEAAAESEEY
ncbi:DUF4352 domain-containing protein [Staphylococcus sp. EZ-P03]|uniref:DUF4352 domain-containing protein n=1 Tax=Staphylococcus sp. EZ-P03 TaxID=2282739 RepID=UPI000DF82D41|nr:DUF4352 domain-containing protein [Staphylococcus sp. EZ-P03]